jgi:hypothetical protein
MIDCGTIRISLMQGALELVVWGVLFFSASIGSA